MGSAVQWVFEAGAARTMFSAKLAGASSPWQLGGAWQLCLGNAAGQVLFNFCYYILFLWRRGSSRWNTTTVVPLLSSLCTALLLFLMLLGYYSAIR